MSEDEIILTHILQCRHIDLVINKPALNTLQQEQFENYRRRRAAGEPLQYILGTCNFMGLELAVNPAVLIPRPETEQLVEAALKYFKGGWALDLGTGSGNVAIALAKFIPQSQIVSVDISPQALEVAKANARLHKVENRIQFIQCDILNNKEFYSLPLVGRIAEEVYQISLPPVGRVREGENNFDLIISNPPYIPTNQLSSLPEDVQKEPALALDGGDDGLNFYRIIIKYTHLLLRKGACLMMEFGDGQAGDIKSLIKAQKVFTNIEIVQDLAQRERIISVKMLG
jgi:release factor glutamine methyltransferase